LGKEANDYVSKQMSVLKEKYRKPMRQRQEGVTEFEVFFKFCTTATFQRARRAYPESL